MTTRTSIAFLRVAPLCAALCGCFTNDSPLRGVEASDAQPASSSSAFTPFQPPGDPSAAPAETRDAGVEKTSAAPPVEPTPAAPPVDRTPVVLATDQSGPQNLVVSGANLYWPNHNGNAIMSVPRAGGAVRAVVAGLTAPVAIAVNAATIYWTDDVDGTVMSVPVGGGSPTMIANGQGRSYGIALDATNLYWASIDRGTVNAARIGSGSRSVLVSGTNPGPLVLAGGRIFWTVDGKFILNEPLEAVSTLELISTGDQSFGLAVDTQNAYWTTFTDGTVVSAPLGGGPSRTLAAGQGQVQCLVVEGPWAYFTTVDLPGIAGRVMKVGINGGALTTIAADQQNPCGLTLDADSVYWDEVLGSGARVLKAPK